ncbi:major capsid protein [Enterocloster citroniae]|uniref:major capsid protein n=1 Tax=Enterocloster citroniae TaxID=358743 RepID=UPI0022E5D2DF|nr:major capsid protein [Enterocloster citroniae]
MPVLPLKEAFTARAIGVFWNTYQQSLGLPPYLGTTLFPKVKTPLMDLKWFYGSSGLPVALTPSNYDAEPTLRDRIGFKQIETEMPFFRESYLVKEKDKADYEMLLNSGDEYSAEILRRIMIGPTDLIQAANVNPERMIWQLLAPVDGSPKIAISANGVNYDYNYDIDGSYKTNNFIELTTATDKWTDLENSDPYEDIRMAQKAHKKKYGTVPAVAVMNDNTFQLIVKNKKIHNYLLAQNMSATIMVTDAVVKQFFREQLKLTIYVYDLLYMDETGTAKTFVPDNIVSLLPGTGKLGETRYGKTPEERDGNVASGELAITDVGVALYTYTNEKPPFKTQCICSEIVLPTYERIMDTYVMKVA